MLTVRIKKCYNAVWEIGAAAPDHAERYSGEESPGFKGQG